MKCRFFALMLCLLSIGLSLSAQTSTTFTVTGQVLDSLTNETVPYATLNFSLASAPKKSVLLLACDIDGKFKAELKSSGKYILQLQSIGMANTTKWFSVGKQPTLNLGNV